MIRRGPLSPLHLPSPQTHTVVDQPLLRLLGLLACANYVFTHTPLQDACSVCTHMQRSIPPPRVMPALTEHTHTQEKQHPHPQTARHQTPTHTRAPAPASMPLRLALLPALRGPPARLRSAAAWGCVWGGRTARQTQGATAAAAHTHTAGRHSTCQHAQNRQHTAVCMLA